MEEKQERWRRLTAKRKSEIVIDILQGKKTISEVSRANDINPATIEEWIEEARKEMENQLITWIQQKNQLKSPMFRLFS